MVDRSVGRVGVRRRRVIAADGVVLVGVLMLMALAPLARVAANGQMERPVEFGRLTTLPPDPRGGSLRDLPVGRPGDLTVESPQDLSGIADQALGTSGAQALVALLDSTTYQVVDSSADRIGNVAYPYRYLALDRILAGAPTGGGASSATRLGAALIELASRHREEHFGSGRYPSAAAAAFAVLDRARAGDDCAPQLDLLFLVAAQDVPDDEVVRTEAARAVTDCPGDPTPGWILGQYLSQRTHQELPAIARARDAQVIFAGLVKDFPASIPAITGAADAHLRTGIRLADSEPFTARNEFRAARQGYARAAALGAGRESAAGVARALIGLGEPVQAEKMLRPLLATSTTPGPLLELLVLAEETAHDFSRAATDARHLARLGQGAYPDGPDYFPAPGQAVLQVYLDELRVPELTAPLSMGADRMAPLTVTLRPAGGADASVEDLSFIPTYRSISSVTGSNPSCADWAWRRDAVLAGHASDALRDFPTGSDDASARNRRCSQHNSGYAGPTYDFLGVVLAEAGVKRSMGHDAADKLADARQNLWRWAGDMPKAEAVIRAWGKAEPTNPLPELRLGEVEYLQARYNDAAATFGTTARLTRTADYRNDLGVDEAMLDRGASLMAAGRAAEATAILRTLDRVDQGGIAYQDKLDNRDLADRFAIVTCYARVQLADHERESGALYAAVEDYAAAQELLPRLIFTGVRAEALYDNRAITELALGHFDAARTAIGRALAIDPANPAFLMTAGYIADRSGQTQAAIKYDSSALESDSGAYPAANDLGVELARMRNDEPAVKALRRAVGARPDYALGWFNLGVLYARMGPAHLLSSQGALGRAFTLDPTLRDRSRRMTIDAGHYRTRLDLSKPLPPQWTLAQSQRRATVASVGLLAAMLIALGLIRARGRGDNETADHWLEPITQFLQRIPILNRMRAPAWALAATVAAFLLPLAHQASYGLTAAVAFGLGVLLIAIAGIRARVAAARTADMTTQQRSWSPGILFGLTMGAIGTPWAPLPILRTPEESRRTHLVVLC